MIHPRETYKSAGEHARHAQRTGTRLLFSGIGFSLAYFLDPQHGASRRKQAGALIRRGTGAVASMRGGDAVPGNPESELREPGELSSRNGSVRDGLRIAR
jgi:hypothetical protein